MNRKPRLGLFEGVGIELEYMLVKGDTLDVLPAADEVLRAAAGEFVSEVELGPVSWSNELVLHVIELKTSGPVSDLKGLPELFQRDVARINEILRPMGGRLMPGGMHPWMDPRRETRLWPHEHNAVYRTMDRIFDCSGHGWSNLQSTHLNLPFSGDGEFARLHAAIRLLLPLLPALAAASPLVEGHSTRTVDNRLAAYRINCSRIPSVTGRVIPEAVFTPRAYRERVLERIYRDLEPFDPDRLLRHEWVNARGAIARFDRDTIEIRLLDSQECPRADLAVAAAVQGVLKLLAAETWSSLEEQQAWTEERLETLLLATLEKGEETILEDRDYAKALGFACRSPCNAGELWRHLVRAVRELMPGELEPHYGELKVILERGTLSRRILKALNGDTSRSRLREVYRELCDCLATGRMFPGGMLR